MWVCAYMCRCESQGLHLPLELQFQPHALRRCWQPNSNPLQGHPLPVTQPSLQLLVVSSNTDISIHPKSGEKNLMK